MAKNTLTLDETIKRMMLSYPSLYRSRVDALKQIFTDSWSWQHSDGKTIVSKEIRRHKDDKKVPGKSWDENAHDRLFARRENAKDQFVIDNADLLAVEEYSKFSYVPSFNLHCVNSLPLKTMDPVWLAGLKELCDAILRYEDKRVFLHYWNRAPDSLERAKIELASAKATATEVLARLAGGENPDRARQQQIADLRRQAAKFGLALVEGSPADLSNVY